MGQIVRCDICGKIYNESNITTHKRRSHATPSQPTRSEESSMASIAVILSIYERLPDERKKEVLSRLAAIERAKR